MIDQDPDVQLHLTFDDTAAGGFEVTAGLLKLDNRYQRQGIAKRFARNAYIVFNDLNVDRVKVHANWNGGGYAWAKLGAVPEDVAVVRSELLKHAGSLLALNRITAGTHAEFVQLVSLNSNPDALLLRVAESESPNGHGQLRTIGGDLLGRHILLPSTWDGIWDFRSSARRAAIESALS